MCEMRVAALVSVLASLLLLAALPASASAGLAGFPYQREIAVQENSGETLRDYQVLVALDGGDFPGEAQPDGGDIRFTDADGRELSYWIEEFDAGSDRAKIWVKVPLIPANDEAMVTMWYGNPGAASESDGDAVFEFFDDFENDNLDKWDVSDGWAITTDAYQGDYSAYASGAPCDLIKSINMKKGIFEGSFKFTEMNQYHYPYISPFDSVCGCGDFPYLLSAKPDGHFGYWPCSWPYQNFPIDVSYTKNQWYNIRVDFDFSVMRYWVYINEKLKTPSGLSLIVGTKLVSLRHLNTNSRGSGGMFVDVSRIRRYTSPEPTITLAPPAPAAHTAITITKFPSPHSIRQFQETTITISIENSGTTDATDIEITDRVHPSFDLTSGDFPNPKRYDLIRPGETRDLQYTIRAKESGTFTLDPATVTYADDDGNIQEAKSEPAPIKVIPSTEGDTSGGGTSRSNPSVSTASVQLHGEKTSVVLGEDILLKLSAVNLITKPTMHVQVIIIPPSGMSVTSSAFAKSGAGQYTTTYELEPGTGKDIEVAIRSNQVGDFDVNGRIIYYFGDDRDAAEDHTLILPITVRAEPEQTVDTSGSEEKGSSTPGFVAVVAVIGLLAAYLRRRI